jgi:hypothetical protein
MTCDRALPVFYLFTSACLKMTEVHEFAQNIVAPGRGELPLLYGHESEKKLLKLLSRLQFNPTGPSAENACRLTRHGTAI